MKVWKANLLILLINYIYLRLAFTIDIPGGIAVPIHLLSAFIAYLGVTSVSGINCIDRLKIMSTIFVLFIVVFISFGFPNAMDYVRYISGIIYWTFIILLICHLENKLKKEI
ncbi:hypothetical protein NNC19_17925 [Clostridium sp. SHJSY1]|uniref:hypothetical protein n=1 Tax=Clostridium sp. SHJSY1 TaxID=2942483 RepID=UPI002875E8FE|nr:hypothetical protein [Clostridium sp. SHJSY1]MDS0527573.1 hypothetical protein [Clostridium sp. SHJSY1]